MRKKKKIAPQVWHNGKTRYVHVLIAEKALGKPLNSKKHPVHHFDEDNQNNANTNLVICESHAYHMLLHKRQRALALYGDPDTVVPDEKMQTWKRLRYSAFATAFKAEEILAKRKAAY